MSSPAPEAKCLDEEIAAAMAAVRSSPDAVEPRMALFQLACVAGEWERARAQLNVLAALDTAFGILAQAYGSLIEAEGTRRRVFAGTEPPVAFGEAPAWLGMLAEALRLDGADEAAAARDLRQRAHAAAPATPGRLGEERFAWLMDADPRLGPTLEVVADGQYRWLPLDQVLEFWAEAPRAMRDLVWQPVALRLTGGRELGAFLPVRYPGSELEEDAVRLARRTRWIEMAGEQRGLGQRLLATDRGDHALLDIRRLHLCPTGVGSHV
jgi:type VI secretion system protein ImpE